MSKVSTLACLILALLTFTPRAEATGIVEVGRYPTEGFNSGFDPSLPTVDIVIHHVEGAGLDWKSVQKQILFAQNAFADAGVQLRISMARKIKIPAPWMKIDGTIALGNPKNFKDGLDFYDEMKQKRYALSDRAKTAFSSMIDDSAVNANTIHVITLNDVRMASYEKNANGIWEYKMFPTAALSFPPYLLEGRVQRHLRGVITVQSGHNEATLAHELGHKLINVSHEGGGVCPKFSGTNVPGLMGYHGKSEIYRGASGRWHRERLHLSPFVYLTIKGKKVWNTDFQKNGRYNDPIYGNYLVKPACR